MKAAAPLRHPAVVGVWERYGTFLRATPAIMLEWNDAPTGARGWLVINSLRGGAAGGGTRMRVGVTPREVTYLAKTMELKFALAGPAIGGAKSGIDFDPRDPRKPEVLYRWYRTIAPYLRDCYGTGGDLNVDEVTEVIPCTAVLGLDHPQEGIVRGHLRPDAAHFSRVIDMLRTGVKAALSGGRGIPEFPLTVADAMTGYGVARSVAGLYQRTGRSLHGARVLLEGFGNVGAAAALYLSRVGARIVGITDAERALVDPDGVDASGVESLIRARDGKLLPGNDPRVHGGAERGRFWSTPADVFVCAALSGSIDHGTLDALERVGVHTIACGANQPFSEADIGDTAVTRSADERFAVLPDFLSNCGMARTFSYLMGPAAAPDDASIFAAVDATISSALDDMLTRAHEPVRHLFAATLEMSLDRIRESP